MGRNEKLRAEKRNQAKSNRANNHRFVDNINEIEFEGFYPIGSIPVLANLMTKRRDLFSVKWFSCIPFCNKANQKLGIVLYTKDFNQVRVIAFENSSIETLFGVSIKQLLYQAQIHRRNFVKQSLREKFGLPQNCPIMFTSELAELGFG